MGNFVAVSSLVPESAEVSLRGVKLASASGGNVALTVIGGIPGRLMGVVRGKVPARPDPSSGTFQGPETNCFSSLPSGAEGCGRPSPTDGGRAAYIQSAYHKITIKRHSEFRDNLFKIELCGLLATILEGNCRKPQSKQEQACTLLQRTVAKPKK